MNQHNKNINDLLEENEMLRSQVNRLKKYKKKSISSDLVGTMLEIILPFNGKDEDEEALWNYDSYLSYLSPPISFDKFVGLIVTLLKAKREDLARFFLNFYFEDSQDFWVENEKTLKRYMVSLINVVSQTKNPYKTELFFKILSFGYENINNQLDEFVSNHTEEIARHFLELEDPEHYLNFLVKLTLNQQEVATYLLDSINNQWVLFSEKITEKNCVIWYCLAELVNHTYLVEKVKGKEETFKILKEGWNFPSINEIPTTNALAKDEITDFASEWNKESDLMKFGYKVSGLSMEERHAALKTALNYLSLRKIIEFIESRLALSIACHKKGKRDYSNAINSYQVDLNYLQGRFFK